ncbi:MAG TPA: hypothetical protein VGR87_11800 [Candidatus Limnocylindria bacterium]|jgi:hypothetical protein|nr:hypothetical protein [Candidatus Limnocylindria bacterium]
MRDEFRHVNEGFLIKLLRAQEHLDSLEGEVTTFLNGSPYRVIRDAKPERTQYRVEVSQEIPAYVAAIAGDFLQNARSALDHFAWRLAGNKADRDTSFPIYAKREGYFAKDRSGKFAPNSGAFKVATYFPDKAQAVIETMQPYHGHEFGLSLLRLHDLARFDRHRLLHLLGGASDDFHLRAGRGRNERGELIVLPGDPGARMTMDVRLGTFEHNTELATFTHPSDVEVECDFAFYVAMREPDEGTFFPILPGFAGMLLATKDALVALAPFLPPHVKPTWADVPALHVDLADRLVQPVRPGGPYSVRIAKAGPRRPRLPPSRG